MASCCTEIVLSQGTLYRRDAPLKSYPRLKIAIARCSKTAFIEPGGSWKKGYAECVNGKLRNELLNAEVFNTFLAAHVLIEQWRVHDNAACSPCSLGLSATRTGGHRIRRAHDAAWSSRLDRDTFLAACSVALSSCPDHSVAAGHRPSRLRTCTVGRQHWCLPLVSSFKRKGN